MSSEINNLQELPTKDLVSIYINIPLENKPSWPELTPECISALQSALNEAEDEVKLVQDGLLDLEKGEQAIIDAFSNLFLDYPWAKPWFDYALLFTRAKAWIGVSMVVDRDEGRNEAVRKALAEAARLMLIAEISANVRKPVMATYVYRSLLTAELFEEADMISETTFDEVIMVESSEEMADLTKILGEKDQLNILNGIAFVDPRGRNSRLN